MCTLTATFLIKSMKSKVAVKVHIQVKKLYKMVEIQKA